MRLIIKDPAELVEELIDAQLNSERRERMRRKNPSSLTSSSNVLRIMLAHNSFGGSKIVINDEFSESDLEVFKKRIVTYLGSLASPDGNVEVTGKISFRTNAGRPRKCIFHVYKVTLHPKNEGEKMKVTEVHDLQTITKRLNQSKKEIICLRNKSTVPEIVYQALEYAKKHKGDVLLPLPSGKKNVYRPDSSANEKGAVVTTIRRVLTNNASEYSFLQISEEKYAFFK